MSKTKIEPLSQSWNSSPIGDMPIPWALIQHSACAEGQIRLLHQMGVLAEEEFKIAVRNSRMLKAETDPAVAHALNLVPELVENNAAFPLSVVVQMHRITDTPEFGLPVTILSAVADLSWLFLQTSVREYLQNVSSQLEAMVLVHVTSRCEHLEKYSWEVLAREPNYPPAKKKAEAISAHCKTVRSVLDSADYWERHNIWLDMFRYTNGLPLLSTEGRKRTWLELDAVMSARTPEEAKDKIAQLPMPEHMFIE